MFIQFRYWLAICRNWFRKFYVLCERWQLRRIPATGLTWQGAAFPPGRAWLPFGPRWATLSTPKEVPSGRGRTGVSESADSCCHPARLVSAAPSFHSWHKRKRWSDFVLPRHRSARSISCSTPDPHWRGITCACAYTPHSTPLCRVADCAARRHASLSQGDRLCCQDPQFDLRRASTCGRRLYARVVDLGYQERTRRRNLVCAAGW